MHNIERVQVQHAPGHVGRYLQRSLVIEVGKTSFELVEKQNVVIHLSVKTAAVTELEHKLDLPMVGGGARP